MAAPHASSNQKKPVQVRLFRITDIPSVMHSKLGWLNAAALMRRWFKARARTMSIIEKKGEIDPRNLQQDAIDETTITMQWVLGFTRAKLAHDKLLASWATPKGIAELRRNILATAPATLPKGQVSWRFGDLSMPAKVIEETCQVNFVTVGALDDPLDDFYGAIGKGVLKLAVTGMVTDLKNGRRQITIDELGTYLRDTYDFNDDSFMSQPLGFWSAQTVRRGLMLRWDIEIDEVFVEEGTVPEDRLYAVQNDDFQSYRAKYGRGGDFVIYSDVMRMRLAKPLVVEI